MDNKKKILLGEKDILSKDNEDLFLNINLNSTFSDIRKDKYENVFDVEKQFRKERNSSRDFRIYGIIDSTITDCDSLAIEVYSNSGVTGLSNLIQTTGSTGLAYNGINVYGKKRGKYLINLDDYNSDYVYLRIPSNGLNYKDQVYSQQLIFKDADGNFVDYGTKTIDISDSGNAIEIDNDFYFLYGKHWAKKDLSIVEEKPAKIFINSSEEIIQTNELTTIADRVSIDIALDKPSPFGMEKANLIVLSGSLSSNEIVIVDAGNTVLTLPHTVTFAAGEQHKILYFYSPLDNFQEFLEDVALGLDNFQFVNTGSPLEQIILVVDKTDRAKVKVNFQGVYQNRNYFSGIFLDNTSSQDYSYPMPSVLRNGLFFDGTPMEFYPADNYTLKIKNTGINTIFPINLNLGVSAERLFLTNEEMSFNIIQEYTNTEKHTLKLIFKNLNSPASPTYYSLNNGIIINGVPLVKYGYTLKISYSDFLAYLKKEIPPALASTIDGWSFGGLDTPFTITEDVANLTLTLVSKNPGTRLDLSSFGTIPNLFNLSDNEFDTLGVKAEVTESFVLGSQVPLVFDLAANDAGNYFAQYQFTISKVGYDTMAFTCSPMPAYVNPDTYYMASGLNTVLRNWDDSSSSAVYMHKNVTSNWGAQASATNPVYGKYKKGDAYINGMVLLANQYLTRGAFYNSNPSAQPALNQSHAINSAGDLSHDLFSAPIVVIPETHSQLSIFNISQYGYLTMLRTSFGTSNSPPPTINPIRSFDLRTGTTGSHNTYELNDYEYGGYYWSSYVGFKSSGGQVTTTNSTVINTLKVFFETGQASPLITAQGIVGVGASLPSAMYSEYASLLSNSYYNSINTNGPNALSAIRLESQTPGVPFEINNIKEMMYTSGPNNGSKYTDNSIFYTEARPNQKAGVTTNLANNYMGGFSVTHP